MAETTKRRPIHPNQVQIFVDGQAGRWIYVTLNERDNIGTFREDADGWGMVQADQMKRVRPGDFVTLISHDGLQRHDGYSVARIEGSRVWFNDRPLRVLNFEPQSLYSDGHSEVIAHGAGFAIRNVRDGHVGDRIFPNPRAAENEIHRRKPSKLAS